MNLIVGDVVHIKPCVPHKLIAVEKSSIMEVSTQHFEEDSYRIQKGDSQK
jgi:quercetin dioxygenase-like cupin family protein